MFLNPKIFSLSENTSYLLILWNIFVNGKAWQLGRRCLILENVCFKSFKFRTVIFCKSRSIHNQNFFKNVYCIAKCNRLFVIQCMTCCGVSCGHWGKKDEEDLLDPRNVTTKRNRAPEAIATLQQFVSRLVVPCLAFVDLVEEPIACWAFNSGPMYRKMAAARCAPSK